MLSGTPEELGDLLVVRIDILRDLELAPGCAQALSTMTGSDSNQLGRGLPIPGDDDLVFRAALYRLHET